MGYCVVRRYTGNPNDLPLNLDHINDSLVPRIREISGFCVEDAFVGYSSCPKVAG
jgi:hypothetical protein